MAVIEGTSRPIQSVNISFDENSNQLAIDSSVSKPKKVPKIVLSLSESNRVSIASTVRIDAITQPVPPKMKQKGMQNVLKSTMTGKREVKQIRLVGLRRTTSGENQILTICFRV